MAQRCSETPSKGMVLHRCDLHGKGMVQIGKSKNGIAKARLCGVQLRTAKARHRFAGRGKGDALI